MQNRVITYLFLSIDKINSNKMKLFKEKIANFEQREKNGNPKYKRNVTMNVNV